jgi:hypothetical protein
MEIKILKSVRDDRPLKNYLVTFRIKDRRTPKGTRQQRYDELERLLEALPAVLRRGHFTDDAHFATSSWLVRSRNSAAGLGRNLSRSLTAEVDLLNVMQVSAANRFELTVDAVEPKPKLSLPKK